MFKTVVGIDPGKNGGIASFNGKMNAGKLPDLDKLLEVLNDYDKETTLIFVEQVQGWVKDQDEPGKRFGIAKLVKNFNQIETTLKVLGFKYVLVHPRTWQLYLKKTMGVDKKKYKNPKNAFKAFAIEQYPTAFKSINLNTADAICITWYGLQQLHTNPSKIIKKIQ